MKEIILPEIIAVGIYNSHIATKNKDVTQNRKTTMFEIELPIGNGGISYIDKKSSPINENMIICAKPGQLRHTKNPFKCYFIHIIIKEGELYDRMIDMPTFISINDRAPYEAIFKKINAYYDSALEQDMLLLQSKILELIYTLCDHTSKQAVSTKSNNKEMIEKVISLIKSDLSADFSLEEVAKYTSFSPIHFHNCFKRSTGKTLREFVEEQRIRKAANLLISTDLTLAEIAFECGFSSQSYFSYVFKRKMKMTPREYEKLVNQRYEEQKK